MTQRAGCLLLGVTVGALAFGCARACAEDSSDTQALQECLSDDANSSTAGMLGCYDAEIRRLEVEVERTFQQLLSAAPHEAEEELRAAQAAWISYRATHCPSWTLLSSGSIYQLFAADCAVRLTRQRLQELAQMLDNPG